MAIASIAPVLTGVGGAVLNRDRGTVDEPTASSPTTSLTAPLNAALCQQITPCLSRSLGIRERFDLPAGEVSYPWTISIRLASTGPWKKSTTVALLAASSTLSRSKKGRKMFTENARSVRLCT
jgi:hypothetical protein